MLLLWHQDTNGVILLTSGENIETNMSIIMEMLNKSSDEENYQRPTLLLK